MQRRSLVPSYSEEPAENLEARLHAWLYQFLPATGSFVDAREAEGAPRTLIPGGKRKPFEFRIEGRQKRRVLEQRDLSKLSGAAGGLTVGVGFAERFFEHMVEVSGIRRTGAQVFTTEKGDDLLCPKSTTGSTATLVAEAGTFAESDNAFGQQTLKAYKYGLLVQLSNELITDTGVDIVDYVARQAGRAVGLASGTHLITGTGTAHHFRVVRGRIRDP